MKSKNKLKNSAPEVVAPVVDTPVAEIKMIDPFPTPLTFQVTRVHDTGNPDQKYLMLSVSSATGKSVYFLDYQTSIVVGEALIKLASVED